MDSSLISKLADELYTALRNCTQVAPLTDRYPSMTLEDAYGISSGILARREADGERVVGKKIGVTSHAVQRMLNVHQPDFGFLTDAMLFEDGATLPLSTSLIQPRAEGELAFVLKESLQGPGVTVADVIRATDRVVPCFEVVDSRIKDWAIKIQDTVADNASCGLFLLGQHGVSPKEVDLVTCGMVITKNGELLSTGAGAAAMGSPVNAVAWLANTLGKFGMGLHEGEIILSGSLVPLEPVIAGDTMTLRIGGIGDASVAFG